MQPQKTGGGDRESDLDVEPLKLIFFFHFDGLRDGFGDILNLLREDE